MSLASDQVAEFHQAFGVTIQTAPTTDIPADERLLRARLVFEEAVEFVNAMGFTITWDEEMMPQVAKEPYNAIDLIEAADALADCLVVVYGSAHTLGIPLDDVLTEVHRSNMTKLGADGKPIYRPVDNKVLKGPNFELPDIASVLRGWKE